jgi:dolichol-phosphate mannosyltransferase
MEVTSAPPPATLAAAPAKRISIVVPLLNEEDNLRELHQRLCRTLERLGLRREIIFVDDGSTDASARVIRELSAADPTVVGLSFSRNFGHEAASTAGLDYATGDAAVLIDADLQDPPEVIEQLVEAWNQGNDVVYAVRHRRQGESLFKKVTSWLFYRLMNWLSDVPIPVDTGDFRLVDAKVLKALRNCREYDRFVRGLVSWAGFRSAAIKYDRPPRHAGVTKYRPLKLLLLSLDAAVGFSVKPLRLATILGFVTMLISCILVGVLVIQKIFHIPMPFGGYALLASGMFFLGGVQMLMFGILGEYVGRSYRQVQGRPLYIIAETIQAGSPATSVPSSATEGPTHA